MVQKNYRQRSDEDVNLHCDLDLEYNNPIFTQDTPAYDDVLSNEIWLQQEQTSSIDMVGTIISDYEPSL